MHARMYIYLLCALWALILCFAGPPLLLGRSPAGMQEAAGPGFAAGLPLVKEGFAVYFWGERLLPPERADAATRLLMNGFTSMLWGVLAGRLIVWIAARRKRKYKDRYEREYS